MAASTEYGVAVVGAAAPIEPAVLDHRRPRPESVAPAGHLGLLVEVAVHENIAVAFTFDFHKEHRCTALQPDDLELHPGHGVPGAPVRGKLDRGVDVAVARHSWSKCGDLAGMRM